MAANPGCQPLCYQRAAMTLALRHARSSSTILDFDVRRGSIFAVMGGSGCGKSTVLKAMIGLLRPAGGTTLVDGEDYWAATDARRTEIGRRFGVLFQSGALWSVDDRSGERRPAAAVCSPGLNAPTSIAGSA